MWVLVAVLLGFLTGALRDVWRLTKQMEEERERFFRAVEEADDWFERTQSANRRRKKIERVLERERERHTRTSLDAIDYMERAGDLIERLNLENEQLTSRNRAIAADVTGCIIEETNRMAVTAQLIRKIRKEEEE